MNNPLIYLVSVMWKYAKGNRRNVLSYVSLVVISSLILALEPLIVGLFLNTIQTEGLTRSSLPHLLLILSCLPLLEVVFWCIYGPARAIENRNAFHVKRRYKNFLLAGTLALPMEWHADHHSGDTIDKIEKGTTALDNFSQRTFEVMQGIIAAIIAFCAMFFFDFYAGSVALGICIFAFFAVTSFDKRLVPGYKSVSEMENTTSAKVFDALSNVTTIIILRVESLIERSIDHFIAKPYGQFNKNSILNEWKWFTASIFGRIAVVVVIGMYLTSHLASGTILVGTVYILYGYSNQIRDVFFRFAYLYNDIVRYRASVSNTELLSDDFSTNEKRVDRHLPRDWSQLTVKDLSFSYHAEDEGDLHLDAITVTLRKGERVALIGESGGGKTTFLKVVRDLYHPRTLELSLDGKRVPGGFVDIADSIALIPQDPEIFATTIRENITLGVEYRDEELKRYTDMARLTDVIARLPHGLDSSVVEKGVNLSGGEKQRLALARGLLASVHKDIILMDEPTSSVDFRNELDIFKNIFDAFPRQTVIASVHRLHLLSQFDTVHFFMGGKIIASGTLDELKQSSPEFQSLWERYSATHGEQ